MNTPTRIRMQHPLLLAAAVSATLCAALPAHAQSKGEWLFRAGLTKVMPQVKSGELTAPTPPDTRIDVTESTVVGGGITYMLTDNWSVDLPLAMPLQSKIKGDGAIKGSGEIGHAKAAPATLFGQYRFGESNDKWRPYVGAGPTFASFFEETGNGTLTALTNPGGPPTNLRIKDKLGFSLQAGLTMALSPKYFAEVTLIKTFLKTTSTLSTGQTIDVKLDPVAVGFYVGYRY
jgi:outer membrane protein